MKDENEFIKRFVELLKVMRYFIIFIMLLVIVLVIFYFVK